MKKDYRKNMMGFQYKLILGIFITGLLFGLFLLVMTFDIRNWMTWVFIAWDLFFAFTIYCWVDEERYWKYEYYLTPVVFGALFLLFAFFAVGGIAYSVASCIREGSSLMDAIGGILGGICCGVFAYFAYIFYLRPYFRKDEDDRDK